MGGAPEPPQAATASPTKQIASSNGGVLLYRDEARRTEINQLSFLGLAADTYNRTVAKSALGNEMSMAWTVTYNVDDHPPFVLRGRSRARLDDGRITLLVDSYDPEVDAEATAWMQQTGIKLDPTYV